MQCLVLLLLLACGGGSAVGSKVRSVDTDVCDPMPKEGDACSDEGAICVWDYGQRGGHTSGISCSDGAWGRFEEVNLP